MSFPEGYVFYTSIALFSLGCLALGLSILFRLRSRELNELPGNLNATVSNRTFVVFNPYPERTRIIHSFLLGLPFIGLFAALALTLLVWEIITTGAILGVLVSIIGLNLIATAEAPEVYKGSRTFVKAIRSGTNLASGDLKALQLIRNLAPKLSKYYLGLSVFFIVFSVSSQYIWTSASWFFTQLAYPLTQSNATNQTVILPLAIVLFTVGATLLQIVSLRVKNRIFKIE